MPFLCLAHCQCVCQPAGQCSMYGICLGIVPTTANTAPTISLITTAAAPATTTTKLGYTYKACAPGQQPYTGAECELGASAQDSQNGNLTSQVLVCAPAACTTLACIASESPTLLNSCVTLKCRSGYTLHFSTLIKHQSRTCKQTFVQELRVACESVQDSPSLQSCRVGTTCPLAYLHCAKANKHMLCAAFYRGIHF